MIANRIQPQNLSTLCERVGVAFEVGLDPHRVFDREAGNGRSSYGRRMRSVAEHVKSGGSLADALKAQGNYFPPHFADMIDGGEKSGRLDRVLTRLAEYYQQMADFRNIFKSSILWPLVQLVLAIVVVGLLIYLPSVLLPGNPDRHDLIGLGLSGAEGLVTYTTIIATAIGVVTAIFFLARNGYLGFMADWAAYIPKLGRTLMVFAEARFVQTLALAIESGVNASAAVDLAFRSAGTSRFLRQAEPARKSLEAGRDMHAVLGDTGLFQEDTLEVIELGEASGRLAELLDKHFRHLKAQVKSSMATITYLASAVIWIVIAAILITIIFRIFSMYVGGMGDAAANAFQGQV